MVYWRIDKTIRRLKIQLDEPRDYKTDALWVGEVRG